MFIIWVCRFPLSSSFIANSPSSSERGSFFDSDIIKNDSSHNCHEREEREAIFLAEKKPSNCRCSVQLIKPFLTYKSNAASSYKIKALEGETWPKTNWCEKVMKEERYDQKKCKWLRQNDVYGQTRCAHTCRALPGVTWGFVSIRSISW